MFVISECWQNILADPSKKSLTLEEKMGRTLKHAGVSITVTSITDILAFSLGAFTVRNKTSVIIILIILYLLDYAWAEILLYQCSHMHCNDISITGKLRFTKNVKKKKNYIII